MVDGQRYSTVHDNFVKKPNGVIYTLCASPTAPET